MEIDKLFKSSLKDDDMTIVRHMKEIVPEFISRHSVYETLDHENKNTASA